MVSVTSVVFKGHLTTVVPNSCSLFLGIIRPVSVQPPPVDADAGVDGGRENVTKH